MHGKVDAYLWHLEQKNTASRANEPLCGNNLGVICSR